MTRPTALFIIALFASLGESTAQWSQTQGPTAALTHEIYRLGDHLFVNGETGGIFRSSDNGMTWVAINVGLPHYPHAYALDATGSLLYACIAGEGMYFSINSGDTWSKVSAQLDGKTFYSVKASGNNIYAGSADGGVYYSTNAGQSWNFSPGRTIPPQIRAFEVVGDTLWIGADGLYYSLNHGKDWIEVDAGIGPNGVSSITRSDNDLYLGAYDPQHSPALFTSRDLGKSWQKTGNYSGTVTALLAAGAEVYMAVAGPHLYRSTNSGASWTPLTFPLSGAIIDHLLKDGSVLFAATTEGVFASRDDGATWERRREGLINHIVRHVFADGNRILSSTERQGVYFSDDQGDHWIQSNAGLGIYNALSISGFYSYAGKLFIGTGNGVSVSTTHGYDWQQALTLEINENVHSLSGSGARIVATTGRGAHISEDAGQTWTLRGSATLGSRHLMSSVTRGDTIVTGTYGEIFASTTGGATWTRPSVPNTNFTPGDMLFSGSTLYVATYQGLYSSDNLGGTWKALTGIPSPVVDVSVYDNILIAGTANGIFISKDKGQSWTAANANLEHQNVYSAVHDGTYLYGGTYGSGVWRTPLSSLVTPCEIPLPAKPILVENCGVLVLTNYEAGDIQWFRDGVALGVTDLILEAHEPGKYNVKVSNECGPSVSNTITFDSGRIPTELTRPVISLRCDLLTLSNPEDHIVRWYKDGREIEGQSGDTLKLTDEGTYFAEFGSLCSGAVSDPILYQETAEVSLYNFVTPNGDGRNETYFLEGALAGSPISIYNRWGQVVYEHSHYDNSLKADALSSGTYFYVINSECHGLVKGTFSIF